MQRLLYSATCKLSHMSSLLNYHRQDSCVCVCKHAESSLFVTKGGLAGKEGEQGWQGGVGEEGGGGGAGRSTPPTMGTTESTVVLLA